MELWIRSQDKLDLMKCKSIHIEEIPSSTEVAILCYANGDKYSTIGYYKTKERALEVLDEIQNILKPKYILNASSIKPNGDYYEENGVIYQNYNADARIEQLNTYVYEMPIE